MFRRLTRYRSPAIVAAGLLAGGCGIMSQGFGLQFRIAAAQEEITQSGGHSYQGLQSLVEDYIDDPETVDLICTSVDPEYCYRYAASIAGEDERGTFCTALQEYLEASGASPETIATHMQDCESGLPPVVE